MWRLIFLFLVLSCQPFDKEAAIQAEVIKYQELKLQKDIDIFVSQCKKGLIGKSLAYETIRILNLPLTITIQGSSIIGFTEPNGTFHKVLLN